MTAGEASVRTRPAGRRAPSFRWTFVTLEGLIMIGGLAGAWQLWDGRYAPPVSDLDPLGLHSWRLPAVYLLAVVAVPSAVSAYAALSRRSWTPVAVLAASALLLFEVTVQIPFVGPSALQAVFGGLALLLGALGLAAHRRGSR